MPQQTYPRMIHARAEELQWMIFFTIEVGVLIAAAVLSEKLIRYLAERQGREPFSHKPIAEIHGGNYPYVTPQTQYHA